MTGYWDSDRERRRKTEFHEILRQRTVGEQMQELPERVKKFFGEWVRGDHQRKYLKNGSMVLLGYLESTQSIEVVVCQYDTFRDVLMRELDSYKVDFLCHWIVAKEKGRGFGDTSHAVLSLTVEETMKFLKGVHRLCENLLPFQSYHSSILTNEQGLGSALRNGFQSYHSSILTPEEDV